MARGRARSGSESTDESPSPGPVTPPMHEYVLAPLAPRITIDEAADGEEPENVWDAAWHAKQPRRTSWQYEEEEDLTFHSPFADSPLDRAKPFLEAAAPAPRRRSPRHSPVVAVPTIVEDEHTRSVHSQGSQGSLGLGLDLGAATHSNYHGHWTPFDDADADEDDLLTGPAPTSEDTDPIAAYTSPSSAHPTAEDSTNAKTRRTFKSFRYTLRMRWVAFKLRVRMSAFRARRRVGLV